MSRRRTHRYSPPDPKNTTTFKVLQNYVRVNLVRPAGAPHMWHAAMQSKGCELTVLAVVPGDVPNAGAWVAGCRALSGCGARCSG